MRVAGSRIGWVRGAGIAFCALVAIGGVATTVLDGEEKPFGSGDRLLPGFSAGYACADARDELTADELSYQLRYEREQWTARVAASVTARDLRGPCSLRLGVPPGSRDSGAAASNVSLARDGSRYSGIVTLPVRIGRDDAYVMTVTLPRDFELFHSLGFGKYFVKFDFFAPGESGSFKQGTVEVAVPDGYSIVDALPAGGNIDASTRSRTWTLKADRDQQKVVTFRHDVLRSAVDLAPEVTFGAIVLILVLVSLSQRAEAPAETEPEVEPVPEPVPEVVPLPPVPVAAAEPEPEPEPELEPEPEPVALSTPARPRPALPPPPPPPPARTDARTRAGAVGLGLLAAAFVVRLFRKRSGRR